MACSAGYAQQLRAECEQRVLRLNNALAQRDSLIAFREKELREWRDFYSGKNDEINALRIEREKCVQLRAQCNDLSREAENTTRILNESKLLIARTTDDNVLQGRTLKDISARAAKLEGDFHKVSDELDQTKRKLEAANRTNTDLRNSLTKAEKALAERTSLLNRASQDSQVFQSRIVQVENANRELQAQLSASTADQKGRIAQLTQATNDQREEIHRLNGLLDICKGNERESRGNASRLRELSDELAACKSTVGPLIPAMRQPSPLSPRSEATIALKTSTQGSNVIGLPAAVDRKYSVPASTPLTRDLSTPTPPTRDFPAPTVTVSEAGFGSPVAAEAGETFFTPPRPLPATPPPGDL